jgi:hypothetical protein
MPGTRPGMTNQTQHAPHATLIPASTFAKGFGGQARSKVTITPSVVMVVVVATMVMMMVVMVMIRELDRPPAGRRRLLLVQRL